MEEMKKSSLIKCSLFLITISLFSSFFASKGSSNEVGITDGLVINRIYGYYNYPYSALNIPSTFTFTNNTKQSFHIEWYLGGSIDATGFWDVNTSSRVVANQTSPGPDNDSHDFAWIWTDVQIDDQIMIFNFFSNTDHQFNVTGEAMHGTMAVWVLEDDYGSEVWYHKEKGFIVNGTFRYQNSWQNYELVPEAGNGDPTIPGYDIFLLIGSILSIGVIISIILVRIKKSKEF
jgi:hypothetical protein